MHRSPRRSKMPKRHRDAWTACCFGAFAALAVVTGSARAMDTAEDLLEIDAGNFGRPTVVDNKYMPLTPGKQLVYEGSTIDDDGKRVSHRIIYTVTDLVKRI